jgi:hypothetical protein
MIEYSIFRNVGAVAVAVASAGVLAASPASAAEDASVGVPASSCTILHGPAGGSVPLCKTWFWDGNDYDGSWYPNGSSNLPSSSYLQRNMDGTIISPSAYSGRYQDKDSVRFRVCDSRAGCSGWW